MKILCRRERQHEPGIRERKAAIQNGADLATDRESLSVGESIGRYLIIKRIGKGGKGEVYLAHDKSLGRDVAIKVLLPE